VGNVVNIVDLLKQHSPETVRFLLLGTHYRSPIEWSDERLAQVRRGLESFYRLFERFQRITGRSFYELGPDSVRNPTLFLQSEGTQDGSAHLGLLMKREDSKLRDESMESGPSDRIAWACRNHGRLFLQDMNDDFNTGGAIGVLFGLVAILNHQAD